MACVLAAVLVSLCCEVLAAKAIALIEGSGQVLTFNKMRRVVVVNPQVADVVVASRTELVVYGKAVGQTKLYVWDARGRHEYSVTVRSATSATAVLYRLVDLLPDYITARALGDRTIVLRGTCPSQGTRQKAVDLAQKLAGEDIMVLDLMTVAGEEISPAQQAAEQLRKLYGPDYEYVVWGQSTVIVRGRLSQKMQEEIRALDEAVGESVRIAAVQTAGAAVPPPVQEIAQAVGEGYKVWLLGENTVVVEGTAPDQAAAERVSKLLEAFSGRAEIVNLVQVAQPRKPSVDEYVKLLQAALGEEFAVKRISDQAIAIEGTVPDKPAMDRLQQLVEVVAENVRVVNLVRTVEPAKKRIIVHIKVVDINRDMMREFGVDWGQIVGGGFQPQPFLVRVERGVNNVYDIGTNLQALEDQNFAKILAEPNIVVNDGEEANILVGGEIPIPVAQPGATGFASITVEYKPYGVTLKVKPEITEQGMIRIKVDPEVSSIDYASGVTIGGMTIPGLRTRRASTTVTVKPGSTLVIGGLIRSDQSKLVRKIPLLGDIPIIGELFKRREFSEGKSELVIFLTPDILSPDKGGT